MTLRDPTIAPLAISLFGPFAVQANGAPLLRLRWRRGAAILALLTLRHPRPVERAWLAGLLWPSCAESQGLATLRRYLTDLRRALGPEACRLHSPTPSSLALDLAGASVDLLTFDAAIARGDEEALAEAVALYRGPLLEGWTEEWLFQEREIREQAYLQALETLASQALANGDASDAEGYLRRAVATDPLRESAQRELMELLAGTGNYGAVVEVYRELRLRLHQELNAEPDGATAALFEHLRQEVREKAVPGARCPVPGEEGGSSWAERLARPQPGTGHRAPGTGSAASTVTFLLTDIEGSTKLWLQDPEAMRQALARHDALLAEAIERHGGTVLKQRGEGDSCFAVFSRATDAVTAAVELQRALSDCGLRIADCGLEERTLSPNPQSGTARSVVIRNPQFLKVRVALHTGEAEWREGDYYGLAVNHCARLRSVGHGGQTLLSQTTAALVRDLLPEGVSLRELGTHRLKDLQRPEPIYQLVHPELPGEFPPLRSLEAFAHNLPLQLTRFIGREREIAEVKRLLQQARSLTLTGAGGCGKTRLGLQVAAELLPEYAEGVWFVELAALSDPALVPQSVAAALGVREEAGRPLLATLLDSLRSRSLLLVLDNCEHLLSACAQLAEGLLRGCPSVRVLATSREGLGIAGEQTYRVPPLSSPDPRHLPSALHSLTQYEAVDLFLDRARLSQPTFTITDQNAPAVAQVCHRLEGMPLALELAAARLRVLPIEQLAARLADTFRLLAGGSRTALPRHQTLRALIDWSYDLLSEPERRLLRRLSVFAGGWTLEAAEAVCAGDGVEDWEVLDLLTALLEKSLALYEERKGEARYRLLETVRQYARDRLLESEEAEALVKQHAGFFLALAEEAESKFQGPEQVAWLDRLAVEHDNFRAALAWSRQEDMESGLRMVGALSRFWWRRGHLTEGRAWLEGMLAASERNGEGRLAPPASVRAKVIECAGLLAYHHGDPRRAWELLEESLSLRREADDPEGIAWSLSHLGIVASHQCKYEEASALLAESISVFRELDDRYGLAGALMRDTHTALQQGDLARAVAGGEESRALFRELDDTAGLAYALRALGQAMWQQGDFSAAMALCEKSATLHREHEDSYGLSLALGNLAQLAHTQGDLERAAGLYREALALFRELGNRGHIALHLEGLAAVAAGQSQPERAARLFGAAEVLLEATGAARHATDRHDYERGVAAARAALGEEGFAAAWAEGRAMSLEQACTYVLQDDEAPPRDTE